MSDEKVPMSDYTEEDFNVEISGELSDTWKQFIEDVKKDVVGQDRAIRRAVRRLIIADSGIQSRERPPSPLFFAGPPATGKTLLAKVLAKVWLGEDEGINLSPLVKISGENFKESHEGAVLKGAPAGYKGYGDKSPLEAVGQFDLFKRKQRLYKIMTEWFKKDSVSEKFARAGKTTEKQLRTFAEVLIKKRVGNFQIPRSVVLIDEFEKMHPDIQQQFLGILEDGIFTLHNGKTIDFRACLFIFTSNIGTNKIANILDNSVVGFRPPIEYQEKRDLNQEIYLEVKKEIKRHLSPEFYSRLGSDGIVVFHSLSSKEYKLIIRKEIDKLQYIFSGHDDMGALIIKTSDGFIEFILKEADAAREGARQIGRLVDKHMKERLAIGMSAGEIKSGDCVLFDVTYGANKNVNVTLARLARPSSVSLSALRTPSDILDEDIEKDIFETLDGALDRLAPKTAVLASNPEQSVPLQKQDMSDSPVDKKPADNDNS